MFLKKSVNQTTGKTFLSLVQGYRKDGKVKQKTIEKIGYLEDLQKEYDDPIAHFTKVAKEYTQADYAQRKIEIDTTKRLMDHCNETKNLGYVIPKRIYHSLGIDSFFQKKQTKLKTKFNLNQIFSLLTFNRFLFPSSKKAAYDTKDIFFESYKFSLDSVYAALDYFADDSQQLQSHMYKEACKLIPCDEDNLGYYDVTNYYFEIPYGDEDCYDAQGQLTEKGFRKNGPSKEHRKDPIVQMGLLMNSKNIPMAFNTFSGADSEKTTMLPAIKRIKRDYGLEKIIVVADRGLNTSNNTAFLSGKNHDDMKYNDGYVYGQSIRGASKEFKAWVLKNDYEASIGLDQGGNKVQFIHKSRVVAKEIALENSQGTRNLKETIYQKQMVYFSQKYADKQKKERELTLKKAKDLVAHPGRYNKATSYGATKYIKNVKFVKSTGELVKNLDLYLDETQIQEEQKYDGYYSIVTSELKMTDEKMLEVYRGLWEIEESFKILKSEFCGRPLFVRTKPHINAHFLVCFTALLILRILDHQLNHQFPYNQIRQSLIKCSGTYLEQNCYVFSYRDEIIKAMEDAFDIDLGNKYMQLAKIKNILKTPK